MPAKAFKIILAVSLLPFCLGFTAQLGAGMATAIYQPKIPYYFLLGGIAYLTVHILFRKPILTYVVGHELTHALFAILFGGSVKSFHASERGGHVTITTSNAIITLAPYFFPLYTVGALLLLWVARIINMPAAEAWVIALAGGAYCFHLILTFLFLQIDQNDIREHGRLFSYTLIYLFNVLFAGFLLSVLLTRNGDYLRFLAGGIIKTIAVVTQGINAVRHLLNPAP